jgi:3alpha(or 20beta)-hydroxysteroid dehydrogenase
MSNYFESVGGTVVRTDIDPVRGVVELDVTKVGDWESVVGDVIREHSHLDGLVNNAGMLFGARPFWEETDEEFARLLDVNVMGTWLGIKVGARAMATKYRGSIVNFSSTSGMMGSNLGYTGYGTTRWAVRGLTKHAAADLASQGLRVNSIHPNAILDTGMLPPPRNMSEQTQREQSNPLGRLGVTDDVGSMVAFLLSDRSTWITGREFVIDGGATLTCAL